MYAFMLAFIYVVSYRSVIRIALIKLYIFVVSMALCFLLSMSLNV